MRRCAILLTVLLWLAALPGLAQAQSGYVSVNVHLRAGPAPDFPVVAILPAGLQIAVQGCMYDYSWCDVVAGPYRGWVYAAYVHYPYGGGYVPILSYGVQIGIGILSFGLLDYWDHHYHHQHFYRHRHEWERRWHEHPRARPPAHYQAPDRHGHAAPPPGRPAVRGPAPRQQVRPPRNLPPPSRQVSPPRAVPPPERMQQRQAPTAPQRERAQQRQPRPDAQRSQQRQQVSPGGQRSQQGRPSGGQRPQGAGQRGPDR